MFRGAMGQKASTQDKGGQSVQTHYRKLGQGSWTLALVAYTFPRKSRVDTSEEHAEDAQRDAQSRGPGSLQRPTMITEISKKY
jgi:hypothetical protein